MVLWILSCFVSLGTANASPITSQQAQQNAMDFLKKKGKTVSKTALRDVSSKDATSKNYYVFNIGNNEGFVIAAADDQVPAILGYSSRGTVLIEAMPANLKAWLDSYDKQISYIQEQGIKGSTPITSTHAAISPLMTTTWDQDDPYNQSCPDFFSYGKSVTGCVATAMAQVMYYHRNRSVNQIAATIPAYTCRTKWNSDDGTQQISVDAVPAGSVIDWNNMLTNYTGSETAAQKKAIADFMFYCGASVSMNYANGVNGGSGAYSEDVPGAMKTYFGYSDNTQLVSRDNYTNDSWDNLIYNELSNHRPVFYSGVTSSNGGHAFVCDGYDSDGYYHINWGWGGYCDTYFLLSDLTPQDQGTGGSSGGYNNNQRAIIGAEPSGNITPPVQQYTVSLPGHTLYYINCYDRNNNLIFSNTEEGMTGGEPASFQCDAGSYLKLEIVWSGFAGDSPSTPPTMYINGNSTGNGQTFTINSLSSDIDVTVSLFKISCDIIGNGSVRITKNGSVISNNASIIDGDQITLELLPDAGYRLKKLEEHIPRMEMEVNELNVQNNTYSFSYSWNHFNGDAQFAVEFEEIPSVQKYTVSVNTTDSSLHIYDKNGNDITEDVNNGTKFDAGSYFHFVLDGDASYISEIKVNGVSVGQWNENNPNYEYVIENLTGDMAVEFTYETPVKYKTVYCTATGPGNVKMYKNGTYVGITTDNGSGYKVVSVVIDPTGSDEIKLEFIPDENCKLSRLGHGFYDVDTETNDISNEISNNTYIIKYLSDEYGDHRCFNACFERVESSAVILNETNFPDASFRARISSITGVAEGGTLTEEILQSVKTIYVSDLSITSLKGIEYFTALTTLYCDRNQLTSLDVSNNTALTYLSCGYNPLTSLDVSKNTALTTLYCSSNQLTSLDVSKNTALTTLYCDQNQLTSLDVSNNTALTTLSCYCNQLTSLDVSNNTALTTLYCSSNQLTSLDVSKNTALTTLYCDCNQLTSLDVSNNTALEYLRCDYNQLTSLDVSKNTALTTLNCDNTQLTSLDVSKNTLLTELWCNNNQLTSLDVSKNTALTRLECNNQSASLTAERVGISQYRVAVSPDFVLSKISNFWVNNVATSPTLADGFLIFSSSSIPQTIRYNYSTGYNDKSMSVTVTISDIWGEQGVVLNSTNFPDPTFRTYISNLTGVVEGGTISEEKLLSIKSIDVSVSDNDYWTNKITSLKGIEFFNSLTTLKCGNNEITSLDVTRNTALIHLDCHYNRLTSLDVTHNTALTYLDCGYNWSINSIDVTKNTELEYLDCHYNGLSSLDVSKNTMLTHLNCGANRLTVLDVTNNTALTSLGCSSNKLTSLDVSKNIALSDSLGCQHNQLTSLDISKNTAIKQLYCNRNNLTSLDVSKNTALNRLWCQDNQLTSLDVSNNTAITELYCHNNRLTSLDVSKNTAITELLCHNNKLTSLDVSNNTALTELWCTSNQLVSLDVSKNTALKELYCDNNLLTDLDVSNNIALERLYCYTNQLTNLNVSGCTALRDLYCGYYEHASLDLSDNPNLITLRCYHSLSALSTGSNLYSISLPTNFDISRVSDFQVDNVSVTPTIVNGTLLFSTTSIPQRITYKYDVANSTVGKMDVNITITSTEEPNYDNTIYMDDIEVLSGTEAVLSVKMKNEVVAEGFEFDMYLPEGITVVQDEDGFPDVTLSTKRTTTRKTNSFDAIFNADGSLRVLAASTNGSAISGNDGEVVQVKVAIADDMAEGDYTVCFKNIAISDENATSYTSAMTTSTIKVNTYIIGDANIDRKVDVADFTAVAHHLLNNTPQSFHMKAADANTDNRIDVGDLTAIAHLILYGTITKPTNTSGAKPFMMMNGSPADENYIYIEPVSVQGQSEVTLSVKMRNAVEAEGFEFDLYLPDGMSFVTDTEGFAEVSLSTERTNSKKTNSFDSVIQEDGSLRVLAASTNGSSISGNDGEVALVTIHIDPSLTAAEYPLLLKNIAIADVNAVSHSTDLKESTITILYNGITTGIDGVDEMDDNADWYTLDGKKLNSKPKAKGVYIMNGQKVVIK